VESSADELHIENATLYVDGNLVFSEFPKRLYGDDSAIIVTGLTDEEGLVQLYDAFIDGGDNGFVIYARKLETKAGGKIKGLLIIEKILSLDSVKASESSSIPKKLAQFYNESQAKNESDSVYYKGDEPVCYRLYIQGGVLSPKLDKSSYFHFHSSSLKWDPKYLKALHNFADYKISYWQEIP